MSQSLIDEADEHGKIAYLIGAVTPCRIGHDGVPRVLLTMGGIVLNQRISDRCVGLAGNHIEPGVALHNNNHEVIGSRRSPNLALITYAWVGNRAKVISGPCIGYLIRQRYRLDTLRFGDLVAVVPGNAGLGQPFAEGIGR